MLTYAVTDTSEELHASTGISNRPQSQQDATALAGDDTLTQRQSSLLLPHVRCQCNGHECLEAVVEMLSSLSVAKSLHRLNMVISWSLQDN